MKGLSAYEKETIILFNSAEDTAEIYTADPIWLRRLEKLSEQNSQDYKLIKFDDWSKTYSFPKNFLWLRPKKLTRNFTEEQLEVFKQRLREYMDKKKSLQK